MKIDGDLVKGVAYYIGDGRSATPRSLSTVNQNTDTIIFFLNWLKNYFNISLEKTKIKIKMNTKEFNEEKIKESYSKKLKIKKENITSVSIKEKFKPHHKIVIDVWAHNSKAKRKFDSLIPIVKSKCLKSKKLAIEYIKGIMAAEGSPKYHIKSGSRSVHLKMKNKPEIRYLYNLLTNVIKIRCSILEAKKEGMWLITISGFNELNKLYKLNIFEIESDKKDRLKKIIESYKRMHVKVGDVNKFYLEKLNFYNRKLNKRLTAPELATLIGRERTRVINVLRNMEKKELIMGQRRKTTGTPFEFWEKN